MFLYTLGGLRLQDSDFQRPKPLLLLTYLALEGSQERGYLAELFWPKSLNQRKNLTQALSRLRHHSVELIEETNSHLKTPIQHDVSELLRQLEHRNYPQVIEHYQGPFLEGFHLKDGIGVELEEWIYQKRESLAGFTRLAIISLAEQDALNGAFDRAAKRAVEAYSFRYAPVLEPEELERLYLLLQADQHLTAKEVQNEAHAHDLSFNLSQEKARAHLREIAQRHPKGKARLPFYPTSFIGRAVELAHLGEQLLRPDVKLITLLSQGGMGKTRLAVEVGQQLKESFKDGVCFASFVSTPSAEQMPFTLGDALNYSFQGQAEPKTQLLRLLKDKTFLLILDNLEHLLSEVSFIRDLLIEAPNVKVLVTSREALHLQAEFVFDLGGLAVADDVKAELQASVAETSQFDAIKLFEHRAQMQQTHFTLDETNHQTIIHICKLLGGMPLAIELAATWLRALSLEAIVAEISSNLDFLEANSRDIPERHSSMRAVFDYSWQLLSEEEQSALRKLAIFKGGFSGQAAKDITGVSLALLASLIDKSFLNTTETARYRRHPLVIQYSKEKLDQQSDEKQLLAEKHALYFTTFLKESEAGHLSLKAQTIRQEIAIELANNLAAWTWSAEQAREDLLGKALWSLPEYFIGESRFQEGEDLLLFAIDKLAKDSLTRARLLHRLGFILNLHGMFEEAIEHLKQSLIISRQHGSILDEAHALFILNVNYASASQKSLEELAAMCRECVALFREIGDRYFEARSLWRLAGFLKHPQEKDQLVLESIRLFRETEGYFGLSAALMGRAMTLSQTRGAYQEADLLLSEAFNIEKIRGIPWRLLWYYISQGFISRYLGRYQKAETHFKEALKLSLDIDLGLFLGGSEQPLLALAKLSRLQHNFKLANVYLTQAQELSKKHNKPRNTGRLLTALGQQALAEKQSDRAIEHCQQALNQLSILKLQSSDIAWAKVSCLRTLADSVLAQGKLEPATNYLHEALAITKEWYFMPLQLELLLSYADLFLQQRKEKRATHFFSLVWQHPGSMFETKEAAHYKLSVLETEVQKNALEYSKELELDEIVEKLLRRTF